MQDGGVKRAGVPQFQQPHVLLVGGLNLFEELCQGFRATLEESGAQPVDWLKEARVVRTRLNKSSAEADAGAWSAAALEIIITAAAASPRPAAMGLLVVRRKTPWSCCTHAALLACAV